MFLPHHRRPTAVLALELPTQPQCPSHRCMADLVAYLGQQKPATTRQFRQAVAAWLASDAMPIVHDVSAKFGSGLAAPTMDVLNPPEMWPSDADAYGDMPLILTSLKTFVDDNGHALWPDTIMDDFKADALDFLARHPSDSMEPDEVSIPRAGSSVMDGRWALAQY